MISNLTGVYQAGCAAAAAELIKKKPGQVLIVCSSPSGAQRLAKDLSFFAYGKKILVLPDFERAVIRYDARSTNELQERLTVLNALVSGEDCVIVAPVMGALKKLPPRDEYTKNITKLTLDTEIERSELISKLVSLGYERSSSAEAFGQFAVRGDIIDIYTPGSEFPARIELFDVQVDSIRLYDPLTQRSTENLDHLDIYPARLIAAEEGENSQFLENFVAQRFPVTNVLWDYMTDPAFILVNDPSRICDVLELNEKEEKEDEIRILETGELNYDPASMPDPEDYYSLGITKRFDVVYCTPFAQRIKGNERLDELKELHLRQAPVFNGHMEVLETELKRFLADGYKISLVCSDSERQTNLKDFLTRIGLDGRVSVDFGSLSQGVEYADEKKLWISEQDIFTNVKQNKKRGKARKSSAISAFTDIKKGDFVVHETHGVGVFVGVEKLEVQGSVSDYLKIKYAGADVLYVPVDQMELIQKYMGSEGLVPKINSLSGTDWQKTKAKAKAAIKDMTEEFLKAAAQRAAAPGYKFGPDSAWQKEFEEAFPYVETDDQLRSVEEIKKDMESDKAMDRLLCGDVGYGKTEVAARAIFKCLEQGKQAAVLVPTTVLCSQHYRTFLDRFKDYPFQIEMMCRFRSDAEQTKTASGLADGSVDLVIGTHRLLSSDIRFKDLGLLVIDEEQRFGVEHKEKIKTLKVNTDVLTLSATPIPRTLHMSLVGIRDMSVLEQPPLDRYPVQTYVMEQDDKTVAEAIRRELGRGGQVYVVYNRVQGIQAEARRLKELVPEANIIIGHGQMGEHQLENVMMDFVEGKADVLLSTTIIESGLDIPNVNTMIVMNADRFGLSQLYQLRGRVGRSNRMAYAYLVYKKDKVLSEIAEKRLRAIREFTEFGSGFRVAMRDLELRGAGNILGREQSGHMLSIGYELYCKLVEEAIRELRGEAAEEALPDADTSIELAVPAYIPEYYISDEITRLAMYKKIAAVKDDEDRSEVWDELTDRFGELPKETENLLDIAHIRHLAAKIGMSKVLRQQNRLLFIFDENNHFRPECLAGLMDTYGMRLTIYGGTQPRLALVLKKAAPLAEAVHVLKGLQ